NGTTVATHTMTQNFPSLVGDMVMYDEGTQISSLNLYATTIEKSLQKVDYAYNVRGWLTDINDINDNSTERDLFNFHLNYDSKEGMTATGSITPLYNGNISQTMWNTANTDNQTRAYGYAYDDLNRINAGFSRNGVNYNDVDSYSLINVSYDKNGNIGGLERLGYISSSSSGIMDDLTYTYNGNQLLSVTENSQSTIKKQGFYDGNTSGNDYQYDVNGNMIEDLNKGIGNIDYNHLNLPETVTINTIDAEQTAQQGTINYIYDATGVKLAKVVNDVNQNSTITTYYAGGYIYENNNGVEQLKMFPHPEGYVEPVYGTSKSIQKFSSISQTTSFSTYQYAFNYTDHLGNVRLTYADSDGDGAIKPSSEIISEKHYYPFGLQQKGYNETITSNVNSFANNFNYNGKEFNEELKLNWHDYGARNYDASIGRWMNIDFFANQYNSYSPYVYTLNNPVKFVDKDGRIVRDPDGNIVFTETGSHIYFQTSSPEIIGQTSDGNVTYGYWKSKYNTGNIYANNGTAIRAYQYTHSEYVIETRSPTGEVIDRKVDEVNNLGFDNPNAANAGINCTTNCHGMTFTSSRLWLQIDQVKEIVENDGLELTEESLADIAVFHDGIGKDVHSATRNESGTYDDNSGMLVSQYGRSLQEASRGFSGEGKLKASTARKKRSVSFFKKVDDKVFDTEFGSVKNGVRTITNQEEISEFVKLIKE
ncbi:RHS repeat protein, partial [Dokdonia pacifica]